MGLALASISLAACNGVSDPCPSSPPAQTQLVVVVSGVKCPTWAMRKAPLSVLNTASGRQIAHGAPRSASVHGTTCELQYRVTVPQVRYYTLRAGRTTIMRRFGPYRDGLQMGFQSDAGPYPYRVGATIHRFTPGCA
jgi:hypothetical protein